MAPKTPSDDEPEPPTGHPRVRLLAVDVDGTLLRSNGTVAESDRRAIAGALASGVAITLATGRLSSSALPFARSLSLQVPLVCADGAVLFCPTRAIPLMETPLSAAGLAAFGALLREHRLAPFVFTHEAVYGAARDLARFPFVTGWTDRLVSRAIADPVDPSFPAITAIGVGPAEAASAVQDALRANLDIEEDVTVFPIRTTRHWVVRLSPGGCTKAVGLARLADQLGIASDEVAAIGDWYNDIPMLAWAGWSFAMGQAPPEVKEVAKRSLRATAETGGAVAEALEWLYHGPQGGAR
jgi:Cof subfamily protein (haloacid dehalogenase superfamily)